MEIKFKHVMITSSTILGLILLVIIFGYSYFFLGFPPRTSGLKRLYVITNVTLSDRKVYYGNSGGFDDWQEYFKFKATMEEVERIVMSLNLKKTVPHVRHPGFYWWSPETESKEIYFKELGLSHHFYLHYSPANGEVHFADVHL